MGKFSCLAVLFSVCAILDAQVAVSPTAAISADELMNMVQTLSSPAFAGRRTGTPGNVKARAWIVARFREAGLTPLRDGFEMPFTFTRRTGNVQGVNVVAMCRGSVANDQGSLASDRRPVADKPRPRVMVISAHYDHLGVRDGVMYPGADDNASGVAVLVALARHCAKSPWTRDLIFAAFDAEEEGLQGARAFVAAPPVAKDQIALNVNLDMVSRSDKRELYIAGTYHRPELRPLLEPVAQRAPITVLFGHDRPPAPSKSDDWTMQSDHGAFHASGTPFVYFGVEDHPDYHKPSDTADKIDQTFLAQVAVTILDAVTALDRAVK